MIGAMLIATTAFTTGVVGLKDSVDSFNLRAEAQKINSEAERKQLIAAEKLEYYRQGCNQALEALGLEKLQILSLSLKPFVDLFSQLKNVELKESANLLEIHSVPKDSYPFQELMKMTTEAEVFLKGATNATFAGALSAMGAWSGVQFLACASTGTPISALAGIAAKNATLAWLGGGSLAAGGFGMAGGAVVMGGVIAGPALLAFGHLVKGQSMKDLENAKSNAAQIEKNCTEFAQAELECKAILRKATLLFGVLARLDALFTPENYAFQEIVAQKGTDFQTFSAQEKELVSRAFSLAFTIKKILDTPILEEKGTINPSIDKTLEIAEQYL